MSKPTNTKKTTRKRSLTVDITSDLLKTSVREKMLISQHLLTVKPLQRKSAVHLWPLNLMIARTEPESRIRKTLLTFLPLWKEPKPSWTKPPKSNCELKYSYNKTYWAKEHIKSTVNEYLWESDTLIHAASSKFIFNWLILDENQIQQIRFY